MPLWLQWTLCAALGLWAVSVLLRKFGLWPRAWQIRRATGKPGGACSSGGCAHCDVAKAASPPASTK